MVVLTRVANDAPAAVRIASRLFRASRVWASIPSGTVPVTGSIPAVPEQKTNPPATIAWLYGPMAGGAGSVEIACRSTAFLLSGVGSYASRRPVDGAGPRASGPDGRGLGPRTPACMPAG